MSLEKLEQSDMVNILLAYGFEDATNFSKDDMITLIKELGVDVPEKETNATESLSSQDEASLPPSTPVDSMTAITETVVNAPIRQANPETTLELDSIEEPSPPISANPLLFTPTEVAIPPSTIDNHDTNVSNQEGRGLTDEQEVKLSSFCDIASSDRDFARSILDDLGWDLDSAIAIYLEGGIQVPPKPAEPQPFVSSYSTYRTLPTNENEDQSERTSDGPTVNNPVDLSEMIAHLQQRHRAHFQEGEEDEDMDDEDDHIMSFGGFGNSRRAREDQNENTAQFYDDGVRVRTDPIRMQRLISRQQSDEQEHIMLGRADDPNIEWMVEPPRHLSYMGSLEHAKTKANEEGRWLLVNIQSHEAWISNELNRTFQDETIECIFRGQYLFWQRGHTSHDGQEFMRLYKISKEDLPIMLILEPNTGARMKVFKEYMEPADLASALIEFHEKHASSLQNLVQSPKGNATKEDLNEKDNSQELRGPETTNDTGAAVAEPVPAPTPAFDYTIFGEVTTAPGDKEPGTIRVAVKLPTKRIQRRFRDTETIRALFAYVAAEDGDSKQRSFDLVHPGPPSVSLLSVLDDRISTLNGVCVNHKWT